MGTGSFPGVKRPGRGADHPLPSKRRGHERVGLYLYSPFGPQWPIMGRTFTLLRFVSLLSFRFTSVLFSFFLSFVLSLFHFGVFFSSFYILSLSLFSVTLNEITPSPDQQSLCNLKCDYSKVCFSTFCCNSLLTSYPTNELNSVSSVI